MSSFVRSTFRMCILAIAASSLMPLSQVANAAPAAQHPLATPARQTIRVLDGYECKSKKVCIQKCLDEKSNTKASCETFCSQCKGD